MKVADLRLKSDDELKQELLGLRKEQLNLRFRKASGDLTNTADIKRVRRGISRIKTLIGERSSAKA